MEEKVYFENKSNKKLAGLFQNPVNNDRKSVVILCHGLRSGKNSSTNDLFVSKFSKEGIATLRFDFHGHRDSEGDIMKVNYSEAIGDVLCAIDFVKAKGFDKIALIGSSFGGKSAAIVSAMSDDVKVLGLKCPASDNVDNLFKLANSSIEELKEKGVINIPPPLNFPITYDFLIDSFENSVFVYADKIEVPVIIVHGAKDNIVSLKEVEKLNDLIPYSRLIVLPNSDHFFKFEDDQEKLTTYISDFIIDRINLIND